MNLLTSRVNSKSLSIDFPGFFTDKFLLDLAIIPHFIIITHWLGPRGCYGISLVLDLKGDLSYFLPSSKKVHNKLSCRASLLEVKEIPLRCSFLKILS